MRDDLGLRVDDLNHVPEVIDAQVNAWNCSV